MGFTSSHRSFLRLKKYGFGELLVRSIYNILDLATIPASLKSLVHLEKWTDRKICLFQQGLTGAIVPCSMLASKAMGQNKARNAETSNTEESRSNPTNSRYYARLSFCLLLGHRVADVGTESHHRI
jgi:hypothetical protein